MSEERYFTDYPFTFLGDEEGKAAPVREVKIIHWDMDKYVDIFVVTDVCLHRTSIKRDYIYTGAGRYGEFPCVSVTKLNELQAAKFLKLRHEGMMMQKRVAQVLSAGGTDIDSWFADLAEQQRCLASVTNMSRSESDDLTTKL